MFLEITNVASVHRWDEIEKRERKQQMKKKNRALKQKFIRVFLKSFISIAIFFVLGFSSYKVTMWYYENVAEIKPDETSLSKYISGIDKDGVAEEVSKNMILATDEETGRITKILVEIVNQKTGNIDYITVPNNLEFTMSYELYKKLATANPDIPQIVCIKKVHKYFSGENLYQCAQLLLEDVMDISFSYYTIIPNEVFKEMFKTDKATGAQKWKDSYKKEMSQLHTKEEYQTFFDKYYEKVTSNLSREKKDIYIETYLEGVPDQIAFSVVSGEKCDEVFVLSVEETNYLINRILENDSYTEENQPASEKAASSVGLGIEILNSTGINGLASSFQEKLVEQGMNVISIGNYSDSMLENTKIIVKEEGVGQDLLQYFKNATIEVGEVGNDIDIRIILGTSDGK